MKIIEKTNVDLFIVSDSGEFMELSYVDPWDAEWDYNKIIGANGGYTILLPKNKIYSADFYQCKEITVYVEKIDEIKERVYVSQIHWLIYEKYYRKPVASTSKDTKKISRQAHRGPDCNAGSGNK